jgi:predicted metal-binding membrane protein
MIAPRITDNRPFGALLIALVILCWLTLFLWGTSPYRRFLSHDSIGDLGGRISLEYTGIAIIFVAAWLLMTVAMMLPTALPLVLLFQRFVATRPNRWTLTAAVIVGYLAVWVLFGIAVHVGDLGIHTLVSRSHWLEDRSWALGATILAAAGVYQFTPLKYLCLEKCRSPFSFIVGHWRGRNPRLDALRLGVHHGIFCVGCCWSLMLLMFAVGVGNVAWMLALGAVMGVEKNMPWGRRISTPLGLLLLSVALGLVLGHVGVTTVCAHDATGGC